MAEPGSREEGTGRGQAAMEVGPGRAGMGETCRRGLGTLGRVCSGVGQGWGWEGKRERWSGCGMEDESERRWVSLDF